MKGVAEELSGFVEQPVVAAPGVHTDALEARARSRDPLHGALHFKPEAKQIPMERRVLADGLVGEPVHLGEIEHAGPKPAEHRAAALRTEVERQKVLHEAGNEHMPGCGSGHPLSGVPSAFHIMEHAKPVA